MKFMFNVKLNDKKYNYQNYFIYLGVKGYLLLSNNTYSTKQSFV